MDTYRFFRTRVSNRVLRTGSFRAKVYTRHVLSRNVEVWQDCRDKVLDLANESTKESPLVLRSALVAAVSSRLNAVGIDADNDAILDTLRLACAAGWITMVAVMTTSGYQAEAFASLEAIDDLSVLRVLIADALESVGWIDIEGLRRLASCDSLTSNDDSCELVLAHAAASGLGEYERRGLFYRRPFLREAT